MMFKSIGHQENQITFHNALFQGISTDGSLFIPSELPRLSDSFLTTLSAHSLIDIGITIISHFIDDVPKTILKEIIENTFSFPVPITKLNENLFLLELFHGPTLAFKDVGARFMAEIMSYYLQKEQKKVTILVATSGDTGSAVAHGFYNKPNIDVYILYPSKKISNLQEKQMTTLGRNIHAIEVKGTFDDCQQLVKTSLNDSEIKNYCHLTTANSINLARLLPQIIYYFLGIAQLLKIDPTNKPTVVVPSGNFGNLTAAAYAKEMGAPIKHLIAATNKNDVFPEYLSTRIYKPRRSQSSLSNAMDVGNPNNLPRLQDLYKDQIFTNISAMRVSDEETLNEIRETYQETGMIIDPHTAVGVHVAKQYMNRYSPLLVAATAHPGKFPEVIKKALQFDMELPLTLQKILNNEKQSTLMENDFLQLKSLLLNQA